MQCKNDHSLSCNYQTKDCYSKAWRWKAVKTSVRIEYRDFIIIYETNKKKNWVCTSHWSYLSFYWPCVCAGRAYGDDGHAPCQAWLPRWPPRCHLADRCTDTGTHAWPLPRWATRTPTGAMCQPASSSLCVYVCVCELPLGHTALQGHTALPC